MPWARLDDGFHDHPKVDGLSLGAVGLYTLCLTWAHRHRRGAIVPGHVTDSRVRKLAGRDAEKLASELVVARLWELEVNLGGYIIHDFEDYLPKQRDSSEASAAGRRGAAKRWQTDSKVIADSHEEPSKVVADDIANDGSRASAPASPSRPVPLSKEPKNIRSAKPSTPDRFDEFYAAFPKHKARAAAKRKWDSLVGRGIDPQLMIDGAHAYAASVRGTDPQFVKQPDGWLNAGRWEDEPDRQPDKPKGWWNN